MIKNKYPMSERAKVISGFAFKSTEFLDSGIPVIKINNVEKEIISLNDCQFVDKKYLALKEKYRVNEGDVLIALTGSHLSQPNSVVGRVAQYCYKEMALLNQRVGKFFIKDKNKLDLLFLYYYLIQGNVLYGLALNATGSANQANISPSDVERIKIPDFELEDQKIIASKLALYDKLMNTNRRRIQLLEEAARLIFREWFVYFRFPGHEKVKVVDGVPEEWKKVTLGKIASRVKKSYSINDEDLPLVDLARIQSRTLAVTEVGVSSDLETARIIFEKDDILFSSIRPYLHKVILAPFKGITNTSVFVVRSKKTNYRAYLTLLMFSDYAVQFANQHSTGTKMPVVKWGSVSMIPAWITSETIMNEFQGIVGPMLEQIQISYFLNHKLAQARDLLLPRLMSGKIEV